MAAVSIQDLIASKTKEMSAKKMRSATLKPASGKHSYRILPSWRGGEEMQFWHDFSMHFIKTAESGAKPAAVYICTEKTYGKECEVCAAIKKSMAVSVDDDMTKRLKDALSAQRYLLNVLHLTGPEPEKVQVLEVGQGVFESICGLISEYGDITDPSDAGTNIIINREGTGLDTKYTVLPAAKKTSVPKKCLGDALINLDEFVAQENPTGETKALTAVGTIIGLSLDASSKPTGVKKGSHPALADLNDAEDADFEPVGSKPVVDDGLDDLDDLDSLLEEDA